MDGKSTARYTLYFTEKKLQQIRLLAGILGKRPSEMINELIDKFLADNSAMVDAVLATRAKFQEGKTDEV